MGTLTTRQREVLELMADGLTAEQTAQRLGLRTETVKGHRKAAIRALGARNGPHAIMLAFGQREGAA